MRFRELNKACDHFYKMAQHKCPWSGCNADGAVFIMDTDKPGYYCRDHAKTCDYCKHATTPENEFYDGHRKLFICPKCQPTVVCQNCLDILHKQNLPILDDAGNAIGCQHCKKQCEMCDKYFDEEDVQEDPDEDFLCSTCWDENWTSCTSCGQTINIDRALSTSDGPGCSDCFAECHICDTAEPREYMTEVDDRHYCEDCFDEKFVLCESCREPVEKDEANIYEDDNTEYCDACWKDNFITCAKCDKAVPTDDANYHPEWGEAYCDECEEELQLQIPDEYIKYTQRVKAFNFGPASRYLQMLRRLAPISIKDLKNKNPQLFTAAKDLISFTHGRPITQEAIDEFEGENSATFGLEYSGWDSDLQRSVEDSRDVGQLVLNVIAPSPLIEYMQQDKTYELFDKINTTSRQSGHPYKKDQLGWARLELDEENRYILVDEIQTDHMNALDRIFTEKYQDRTYAQHMKRVWHLSDEEFKAIVDKLKMIIKQFPDLIIKAISDFARANGFDRLYWHTYESGKKLKSNNPPRSLYTKVPKKNFFKPTDDKPFDLDGEFLERMARRALLGKIIKHMHYNNS